MFAVKSIIEAIRTDVVCTVLLVCVILWYLFVSNSGLIDGHTHPVWVGDRVHEFAMKVKKK